MQTLYIITLYTIYTQKYLFIYLAATFVEKKNETIFSIKPVKSQNKTFSCQNINVMTPFDIIHNSTIWLLLITVMQYFSNAI